MTGKMLLFPRHPAHWAHPAPGVVRVSRTTRAYPAPKVVRVWMNTRAHPAPRVVRVWRNTWATCCSWGRESVEEHMGHMLLLGS